MGCATSKQTRRDRRRRSPSPYSRSQSMPVPHNNTSSRKIFDSNRHIVALTSTTLGSLSLDSDDQETLSDNETMRPSKDLVENAKTWSEMIIKKLPTPTPTSEPPETIDTWELMAGLEEPAAISLIIDPNNNNNSIVTDFDQDILADFREALYSEPPRSPEPKLAGIVKERIEEFQRKIDAKKDTIKKCPPPPNYERKVVLYFTSLRGIRKTYEDCWAVRVILQGYGVKVDERDVSMHGGFKEELNTVLGVGYGGSRLPRVFADGVYLGGVEEVKAMHEAGELWKALEECEATDLGKGGVCEGCGGLRFVPCENCSGSCKVFVEEEEEEEEEEVGGGGGGGFRRCSECNENGLVLCTFCL